MIDIDRLRAMLARYAGLNGSGIIIVSSSDQRIVQAPTAGVAGRVRFVVVRLRDPFAAPRLVGNVDLRMRLALLGIDSPTIEPLALDPFVPDPLAPPAEYELYVAHTSVRPIALPATRDQQMAPMLGWQLALQQGMQQESRLYTTISNITKAQHDIAKNSIDNMKA
jgi:hypothetical protein